MRTPVSKWLWIPLALLKGLSLSKLNDFFRAYARLDVQAGSMDLVVEFAAKDGRFMGYVKPLFRELNIVDAKEEKSGLLKAPNLERKVDILDIPGGK